MPIELLDRLRNVVHNMGYLDEGGEEQAAFLCDNLPQLWRDMEGAVQTKLNTTPRKLVAKHKEFLEAF